MTALLLNVVALASSNLLLPREADVAAFNASASSWRLAGRAPSEELMTLTAVLTVEPQARAALEATFWAVSNPKDAKYGKHLTAKQLKELLAVPEARTENVRSFFAGLRGATATPNVYGDAITLKVPVAEVERALHTSIGAFTHSERPEVRILRATTGYSLPLSIAADVVMVGDLVQFPALRPKSLEVDGPLQASSGGDWPSACAKPTGATVCKGQVTPTVLGERYKIPVNDTTTLKGTMAVAEFQGQYFKPTDLADFSSACHVNVSVDTVIGGNRPSPGVEAELDIEYIKGVAVGVPLTVIYAQSYSLLNWATKLMDMSSPPLINSVSYGNDEKQQSSKAYMESVNTAFMKAGTLGLSILFASGDQGVCGREGCGLFIRRFKPDFPGGSPYHTSVGGTDFNTNSIGEEKVWEDGGGGFSDTFPIPDYQAEAVAAFKNASAAAGTLPSQKYWNNTGRGYPDVSALGGQKAPYCVATGGRFAGVAGTSASTPVVAGVFARLNAIRLAKGNAPLGFLNPLLYANPQAFQDVTIGKNSGGARWAGFTAIAGWDAASGLGTPDYEALTKIV